MDEIDEMGEIGLHFALLARATSLLIWGSKYLLGMILPILGFCCPGNLLASRPLNSG